MEHMELTDEAGFEALTTEEYVGPRGHDPRDRPALRAGPMAALLAGLPLAGAFALLMALTGQQRPAPTGAANGAAGGLRRGDLGALVGESATWTAAPGSKCPRLEVDVEYKDNSGFGVNLDHIPSPELCCSLCQANPACKAFTWVKDALPDGDPGQCWLKGGVGIKAAQSWGKVSGVPPPRTQVVAVPSGAGDPANSMFCFALMLPFGGERKLLAYQWSKGASIFACNGYAVYSNMSLQVGPGLNTKIVASNLACGFGGDSNTALNSWIFIAVWDKVTNDQEYRRYKWVVKADPDCVFFPDRLVPILRANAQASYINNCQYGLHGPIEVFSRAAIDRLAQDYAQSYDGKAPARCVKEQNFGLWGEDMFIDQCFNQVLKLPIRATEPRVLCEDHCDCSEFFWCTAGADRVAYHPFKTVGAYDACIGNALTQTPPSVMAAARSRVLPGAYASTTNSPYDGGSGSATYGDTAGNEYGGTAGNEYGGTAGNEYGGTGSYEYGSGSSQYGSESAGAYDSAYSVQASYGGEAGAGGYAS